MQTFLELDERDVSIELSDGLIVRPLTRVFHHKPRKRSCAMALFSEDGEKIKSDCDVVHKTWAGSQISYLGQRFWAYSHAEEQTAIVTCATGTAPEKTIALSRFGVIEIPIACSLHSDSWVYFGTTSPLSLPYILCCSP